MQAASGSVGLGEVASALVGRPSPSGPHHIHPHSFAFIWACQGAREFQVEW